MQIRLPSTAAISMTFFGMLVLGCTQRAAPPGGTMPEKIAVQVIDENDLARAIAQRKGKVVLVDFWATWCIPCTELFPHTVQLHRSLADKGLDVISVSLDDPDNKPAVLRFLVSKGAQFENFISRYGISPKSMQAFEIPGGSLPHLRLYNRRGALYRSLSADSFRPADIDRAVHELLLAP